MKAVLSIKSIKPKVLRERKELSLLQKTAIYRWNNDGSDTYLKWFNSLSCMQKAKVCLMGLIPFDGRHPLMEDGYMKKVKF